MIADRKIAGIVISLGTRGQLPVANIQPLVAASVDGHTWELDFTTNPDLKKYFPNAGRVSWIHPPEDAVEGTIWQFDLDEQPSYKKAPRDPRRDYYMVKPGSFSRCLPVLDVESFGGEDAVRRLLTQKGIRLPKGAPTRFYMRSESTRWSEQELEPGEEGSDLHFLRLSRIDGLVRWISWVPPAEPLALACGFDHDLIPPWMRLLPPDVAPSGSFSYPQDWSTDEDVLRHLLGQLRRHDREFTDSLALTREAINRLTHILATGEVEFSDPDLQRSRLARVEEYIRRLESTDEYVRAAMVVIQDSPVADEIEQEKTRILESELQRARQQAGVELREHQATHKALIAEIKMKRQQLQQLQRTIEDARAKQEQQVQYLEDYLVQRVNAAMEKPEELLGSIALFRAVAGNSRGSDASDAPPVLKFAANQDDTRDIVDPGLAFKGLQAALVKRDVPISIARPLYAGFLAGLIPILSGGRAYDALAAYADCFAGGRLVWLPVSPGWLDPADALGQADARGIRRDSIGLLELLRRAPDDDLLYLVVFDGVNRAPAESWLLPLLACYADVNAGVSRPRTLPIGPVANSNFSGGQITWPENILIAGIVASGVSLPIAQPFWECALPILCDAVPVGPESAAFADDHPNRRDERLGELTSVPHATWREWRSEATTRPLGSCTELISSISQDISFNRVVRDMALRFFAASVGCQAEPQALGDTVAHCLLPHLISDQAKAKQFLADKDSIYRDADAVLSDLDRIVSA